MATITRPRVVTESEIEDLDLPQSVSIALGDHAVAAKQRLLALAVGVGLAVVEEIFEEEVSQSGRSPRQARRGQGRLPPWP
jgi:hypothetical protein